MPAHRAPPRKCTSSGEAGGLQGGGVLRERRTLVTMAALGMVYRNLIDLAAVVLYFVSFARRVVD